MKYSVTIDGVKCGEYDNVQEIAELCIAALMKGAKIYYIERVENDESKLEDPI